MPAVKAHDRETSFRDDKNESDQIGKGCMKKPTRQTLSSISNGRNAIMKTITVSVHGESVAMAAAVTTSSQTKATSIAKTRWAAYAAAGAATAIVGSNSAEAAIHYSGPLNVQLKGDQFDCGNSVTGTRRLQLDQRGDSLRLDRFLNSYCRGFDFCTIFGVVSAAFRAPSQQPYPFRYLSRLSAGQRISSGTFSPTGFFGVLVNGQGQLSYRGYWTTPGMGFIGFRFNNGSGIQYGWARIKLAGFMEQRLPYRLLDYAYADPDEPIRAGQTSSDQQALDQGSDDEQVPDEGSLGGLALGAIGVLAWRESRSRPRSFDQVTDRAL